MRQAVCLLVASSALLCGAAQASIDIYSASLFGANECALVSGSFACGSFGDPDGFGGATVMIDNLTNTVTWSIVPLNIEPAVAAHIHLGAAGTNGSVIIDFSGAMTGSIVDSDAGSITPLNFADKYVNVHTASFPGGAIRGQLAYVTTVNPPVPEPATYALLLAGAGVVGLAASRRKRIAG
jgi:hypothetical protein